MGYESKADGPVVRRGKTKCDVMPTDGPKVVQTGPKANKSTLNKDMKKYGTNIARSMNQKKSGRGR